MFITPKSKPIASAIGTIFGGLWAYLAAAESPPGWQLPLTLLAGLVTLLLIARLWGTRPPAGDAKERLFGRKPYLLAVVLEVGAIYLASILLPRFGLEAYFLQVVGIIVGLHFIGLWRATGASRFIGIAVGMCVVSAAATLLPELTDLLHLRDVATGLGNALVLWIGAGTARPGGGTPGGGQRR